MNDAETEITDQDLDTDSLSTGVTYMVLLAVAQRGVGFLRTALFCRLLAEQELGQWSLVFSFVMFSAPMTLMGITGSFGRYVEYYFQRGLVRQFFRRTAFVVTALTGLVLTGMWVFQDSVSWCLFGSVEQRHLLLPACITLLTTILYNYYLEVVIALRRIKAGSLMSLISSWVFAVVAVASLYFTNLGSYGVIIGFAVGNLVAAAYAYFVLMGIWNKLPQSKTSFSHSSLWKKLAPFALGLWVVNLITNTFDMVDRYMIIHFSGLDVDLSQGLVGQYFSSMAIPLLMVGVSTSLAHLVMPYLSKDWEQGKFKAVSDRVNLSMKMLGMMLCIGSALVILVGPIMFDVVFGGKYDAGYAVLPWTVAFCFWRAVSTMCYNYLFCVERTRLMCVSLFIGLVANIAFNALLLPSLGLLGAALATSIGSALNLAIVMVFNVKLGLRMSPGVIWVFLFPLVLPFGATVSAIAIILLIWIAIKTTWVFSKNELEQIDDILSSLMTKVLPGKLVHRMGIVAN